MRRCGAVLAILPRQVLVLHHGTAKLHGGARLVGDPGDPGVALAAMHVADMSSDRCSIIACPISIDLRERLAAAGALDATRGRRTWLVQYSG